MRLIVGRYAGIAASPGSAFGLPGCTSAENLNSRAEKPAAPREAGSPARADPLEDPGALPLRADRFGLAPPAAALLRTNETAVFPIEFRRFRGDGPPAA